MKRIAALLLCLALAVVMLQPLPLGVNSSSLSNPLLAEDPPPPYPPPPKVA